MRYLYDSALGQPLLAFVFAYYLVNVIGAEIRKRNPALADTLQALNDEEQRSLKKNRFLRLLSLGFVTITICFALFPFLYQAMAPISMLKYPVYNLFGLILLGISFVKMLLVHVDMDQDMYYHNLQGRQLSSATLMSYSHRMLGGYYTMFVGFTLILSNWVSVLLLVLAAVAYRRK